MQYKQTSNIICIVLESNQIKAKQCSKLNSVMLLFAQETNFQI